MSESSEELRPRYLPAHCTQCGSALQHVAADEWRCPRCRDGVALDWSAEQLEALFASGAQPEQLTRTSVEGLRERILRVSANRGSVDDLEAESRWAHILSSSIIYAAGRSLNLTDLARALRGEGALRDERMMLELDTMAQVVWAEHALDRMGFAQLLEPRAAPGLDTDAQLAKLVSLQSAVRRGASPEFVGQNTATRSASLAELGANTEKDEQ